MIKNPCSLRLIGLLFQHFAAFGAGRVAIADFFHAQSGNATATALDFAAFENVAQCHGENYRQEKYQCNQKSLHDVSFFK